MQQFKWQNQGLTHRRNAFMRDIRNIQRDSIKKRARSQIIKRNVYDQLKHLINITHNYINNQELSQLIQYANEHNEKAIAHLGNLVIAGVVKIPQLEKYTLKPGYSPIWLWLIEILVEHQYCTMGLFDVCIKTIKPNRLEKSVFHSLSILYKITSSNLYSSILMREQKVLLSIINSTFRNDPVCKVAYLLLHELIAKQQDIAIKFKEGILRQRMIVALKSGLMSNIMIIQKHSCNILKQLQIKGICFHAELKHSLITFIKSKYFIDHSSLFLNYLKQFVISEEKDKIVQMVDLGMLVQLGRLKKQYQKDQCDGDIAQIIQLCREIKERTSDMGVISKGIFRELNKLNLLSFQPEN